MTTTVTTVAQDSAVAAWRRPVIRVGVFTLLLVVVLSLLPCLYLYLKHDVFPAPAKALEIWLVIAATFGAFYIVEPISYYPVLGLSGTYMSFLAGNIANMRLPCSAAAQDAVGVRPGTQEAEIVSTLGIAGSIVTNLVFVTMAAIAGDALLKILPGPVQEAFQTYSVPAIFGAIYGQFALKYPKLALAAVAISAAVFLGGFGVAAAVSAEAKTADRWAGLATIVSSVFGTIAIARLAYKKGWVK